MRTTAEATRHGHAPVRRIVRRIVLGRCGTLATRSCASTLLALLIAAAGCGGERGAAEGDLPASDAPRQGGTAVVTSLAEVNSLNHFVSIDETSHELQTFVLFATLLRYDEELRPQRYLAESWDTVTAGEGVRLRFRLRDDAAWHDGEPTTARDVKFTFERLRDPATGYPWASRLAEYDSAVVEDSLTISFFLEPYPGFLDPWCTIPPMPEHVLGTVPPEELRTHPFGTQAPVGNGPFRFVEHRPGDRWVFEANPDFPESMGGRPHLDRLVYRIIPDPTTRLSELVTGGVDVYLIVSPGQVDELAANPDIRVITHPTRGIAFIIWNGEHPFLAEPRVRRALALGIDRGRIVESARRGLGRVATGPLPPYHWGFHSELEPLPHDPGRAAALLDSAGWVDSGGDGIRERDGERASFELRTNPNPDREDILTLVQDDLAELGVEVRTRVQEAQSLGRDITSPERSFDAVVLGWRTEFVPDDRPLLACSRLDTPFQMASYCNPRVDEILDRVIALDDREAALPLWHEYQEILQRDQPYTFLYYDVRANAVRRRLRGVEMDGRGDLVNVGEWWVASLTPEPTAGEDAGSPGHPGPP